MYLPTPETNCDVSSLPLTFKKSVHMKIKETTLLQWSLTKNEGFWNGFSNVRHAHTKIKFYCIQSILSHKDQSNTFGAWS